MAQTPTPDDEVLAPAWRAWIAENLLRGTAPRDVTAALVGEGLDEAEATAEVARIAALPELAGAMRALVRGRRLEQVAELLRRVARDAAHPHAVPRREGLDADAFFDELYATSSPAVLPDLCRDWPAMRWTFAGLAERFGDVEVTVTSGREGDPDYDIRHARLQTKQPLREVIARIEREPESNDFYMIARGRNTSLPELARLFDDLDYGAGILAREKIAKASALWLGPAGTITPLHHDTSNILFVQIVGRKRFRLVSPLETALFERARAVYALGDDGRQDLRADRDDVLVKEVVLEPGEALFIPVGWWHHVVALDPSISLALNCFPRPNDFDWYRPGALTLPNDGS